MRFILFDGESLLSFFFRKQQVYGEIDFSNLINSTGRPYIIPKALVGRRFYCGNHKESDLVSLLEINDVIRKKQTLFNDPTHYLDAVKKVFFHEDFPNNYGFESDGIGKVVFCNACIVNSIYKHGVGYLKFEWLKNGCCSQHSSPLLEVSCTTRKKMVDTLKMIISGQIPEASIVFTSSSTKKEGGDKPYLSRMRYFHSFLKRESPIVMTECLANDFYHWVRSNRDKVTDAIARKLQFGSREKLLFSMDNYRHQYENTDYGRLACFFFAFWDMEDSDLKEFLDRSSYEIDVYFGAYNQRALSERMMKSNRCNCSLCPNIEWSKNCPASQVIIRKRQYYPIVSDNWRGVRVITDEVNGLHSRSLTPKSIAWSISKYPESKCLFYSRNDRPYSRVLLGWTEDGSKEEPGDELIIDIPVYS